MKLYLMRHGHAQGVSGAVTRDTERPLSNRGRAEVVAAGQILSQAEPDLKSILTSPLKRAIETGSIVAAQISPAPSLTQSEDLIPGFHQKSLLGSVVKLGPSAVLAIGHQPDMSQFVSFLISDSRSAVDMETGTLACLEFSPETPHSARLLWLLPPSLCRVALQP